MTKIVEIMDTEPYVCHMDSTVGDVIRKLTDVRVSGVPIVDAGMRPIGFITDIDIIRFISHNRPQVYDWGEHLPVMVDESSPEEKLRALLNEPVSEVASSKIVCVETSWNVDEVADHFKQEKVRKMAVLEDGKIVGVITRSAILRFILSEILPSEE